MSLLTVEGIYKDGKIELAELPNHVDKSARVLVTFLPPSEHLDRSIMVESQDRETLRQQAFARMKEGIHLGGPPLPRAARNSMTASTDNQRALVDTNIVVYAYDLDDPRKHTIARELIEELSSHGRLVWTPRSSTSFARS